MSLQDAPNRRLLQQSKDVTIVSRSYNTPILNMVFTYSASINLEEKNILIGASESSESDSEQYFYATPTATVQLQKPYNNLPTTFYDESHYDQV